MSASIDNFNLEPIRHDSRLKALQATLGNHTKLWLVGGALRDVALGRSLKDLDFACALHPDELQQRCGELGLACYPTGAKHLTITVIPGPNLEAVEISTFRSAGASTENGSQFGTSIEEDLAYRDFTINSLAMSCESGQVLDPTSGLADIAAGLIRANGASSERFAEDPLRILRMIRLSSTLDFSIEQETLISAKEAVELLAKVSMERIREEFSLMLCSDNPRKALSLLEQVGALEIFLPEIKEFVGFEQNRFHYADLWEHSLQVVEKSPNDLRLRLAALLHDVGKPRTMDYHPETNDRTFYRHEHVGAQICKTILERLRFSKKLNSEVCTLVKTHMRPLTAGKSGIRRLIRDVGPLLNDWETLKEADSKSCNIDEHELERDFESFRQKLSNVRSEPDVSPLSNLAVNGSDLLEAGYEYGPEIGEILRALHEKVLDDPSLNNKSSLLALAKDLKSQSCSSSEPSSS